jgi:peptide/nickel transport system permease protein
MTRYVMVRVVQGIIALFVSTIVIFGLSRLSGNPIALFVPANATVEVYEKVAEYLGLDEPLHVQYWEFISKAARGDFGHSYFSHRRVLDIIVGRFPATIKLAGAAVLISLLVALPVGVLAAVKREKWQDQIAKGFAVFGQAVPGFWLGIMLILFFAVKLGWLPAGGYGGIQSYILPAICLATFPTAGVLRVTRSSMLEVLSTDYVRLARIKGLPERSVIWKHTLRNALIPVVTLGGLFYTFLLTSAVVTETVFAWPGVGRLAYNAVMSRDFPLIQGLMIIFVALFVIANLAIDILYVYLDPRVRYVK